MATTASRVARNRPTTKPTGARSIPPTGKATSSPKATATAARPLTKTVAAKSSTATRPTPNKGSTTTKPTTAKSAAATKSNALATQAAKKPTRVAMLMESVQSVQEQPIGGGKPWPRWRKIALWAVMLMPVYAIIIYLVGSAYFIHAGLNGVGLNKSLPTKVLKVVNGISVPDQEGVFFQTGTDPTKDLSLLMPFNDRSLKPPTDQQFTLSGGDIRYLLVRQAQVSLPTDYQVFTIDNKDVDHLVKGVVAQRVSVPRIALISLAMPNGQAWAPGSYVLVSPDLDDGTYYYFFTVTK